MANPTDKRHVGRPAVKRKQAQQSIHLTIPKRVYDRIFEIKPETESLRNYVLQSLLARPEIGDVFTMEEKAQMLAPSQMLDKQQEARRLRGEGMAVRDIAEQLQVPRQTVYSWLKKR